MRSRGAHHHQVAVRPVAEQRSARPSAVEGQHQPAVPVAPERGPRDVGGVRRVEPARLPLKGGIGWINMLILLELSLFTAVVVEEVLEIAVGFTPGTPG